MKRNLSDRSNDLIRRPIGYYPRTHGQGLHCEPRPKKPRLVFSSSQLRQSEEFSSVSDRGEVMQADKGFKFRSDLKMDSSNRQRFLQSLLKGIKDAKQKSKLSFEALFPGDDVQLREGSAVTLAKYLHFLLKERLRGASQVDLGRHIDFVSTIADSDCSLPQPDDVMKAIEDRLLLPELKFGACPKGTSNQMSEHRSIACTV